VSLKKFAKFWNNTVFVFYGLKFPEMRGRGWDYRRGCIM